MRKGPLQALPDASHISALLIGRGDSPDPAYVPTGRETCTEQAKRE